MESVGGGAEPGRGAVHGDRDLTPFAWPAALAGKIHHCSSPAFRLFQTESRCVPNVPTPMCVLVSLCTYASFQRGRRGPPRDLTPEAMPNLSVTNGACSASPAFKIHSSITPNFHFLSTPRLRISIYAAVKAHYPVTIVYCNDIISPENTDCFLNTGYIPGHFQ